MKNAKVENEESRKANSAPDKGYINTLQQKPGSCQKEKHILPYLNNDITKGSEKNDLVRIPSSRPKGIFYFTYAFISLIGNQNETYFPFLIGVQSVPGKDVDVFYSLVSRHDDPVIKQLSYPEPPVSFFS